MLLLLNVVMLKLSQLLAVCWDWGRRGRRWCRNGGSHEQISSVDQAADERTRSNLLLTHSKFEIFCSMSLFADLTIDQRLVPWSG